MEVRKSEFWKYQRMPHFDWEWRRIYLYYAAISYTSEKNNTDHAWETWQFLFYSHINWQPSKDIIPCKMRAISMKIAAQEGRFLESKQISIVWKEKMISFLIFPIQIAIWARSKVQELADNLAWMFYQVCELYTLLWCFFPQCPVSFQNNFLLKTMKIFT